jgi:hypothetical protein
MSSLTLPLTMSCTTFPTQIWYTAFQNEMSGEPISPVLRCELCSKPFNKGMVGSTSCRTILRAYTIVEATLKRHRYYCRSRRDTERTARLRSCIACAKAKARCNNVLPNCARCTTKGLHCRFPGSNSAQKGSRKIRTDDLMSVDQPATKEVCGNSGNETQALNDGAEVALVGDINTCFDLNSTGFEDEEQSIWSLISVEKAMMPTLDFDNTHPPIPGHSGPLFVSQIEYGSRINSTSLAPNPGLLVMPNYDLALRSFTQRPAIKGGALTTYMLMLRLLTSYPIMLRDPKSPPPFIHPSFLSDTESKTMESLTTCASLVQMLDNGGIAGRRLLWKNIRLECERVQVQVSV